jgi:hypothetical protein
MVISGEDETQAITKTDENEVKEKNVEPIRPASVKKESVEPQLPSKKTSEPAVSAKTAASCCCQ